VGPADVHLLRLATRHHDEPGDLAVDLGDRGLVGLLDPLGDPVMERLERAALRESVRYPARMDVVPALVEEGGDRVDVGGGGRSQDGLGHPRSVGGVRYAGAAA
jgi:hypothetical protein